MISLRFRSTTVFLRCSSNLQKSQRRNEYTFAGARALLQKFDGGQIRLEKRGQIAYVAVENPSRKNALTGKMMCDLDDIVTDLEKWNEGGDLIVRGDGENFCSGGDLRFVKTICNPRDGLRMSLFMQHVLSRLQHLPLISVAVVEGKALGGGAELSMATDFRLMSPSAQIGFVQRRVGVTTGWGGFTRLSKLVSRSVALSLLASGELLTATRCQDLGLCQVSSGGNVIEEAEKLLTGMIQDEVAVSRVVKQLVSGMYDSEDARSLTIEREYFGQVWGSAHHQQKLGGNIRFRNE